MPFVGAGLVSALVICDFFNRPAQPALLMNTKIVANAHKHVRPKGLTLNKDGTRCPNSSLAKGTDAPLIYRAEMILY